MPPHRVLPILGIALALLLGAGRAGAAGGDAAPPPVNLTVDWTSFLAAYDLRAAALPTDWTQAPHLGNATLGSMVYRSGNALCLQLFHADVQDHRDASHGWTAYSRPRFEIGALHLDPVGQIQGGEWRLDLWNAELTGRVTTDGGEIRFRHYVHAERQVMVTEWSASGSEAGCRWSWHPAKAETARSGLPRTPADIEAFAERYGAHYRSTLQLYRPNPEGRRRQVGEVEVWQQDLSAGGQYATAWAEATDGPNRRLFTSVAHAYPEATAVAAAVREVELARQAAPAALGQAHRAWWNGYYPRSFVRVPDPRLAALYWQTIYRYGATARQGRAIVNTAGLWFQGAQWPYVTTDWNLQAALWALPAANRLEQSGELLEALHRHRATLVDNVRPVDWQADSAFLALAVAPDFIGARDQDMRYWDLAGNLPWALHNAWWQYRYSMDDTLLRTQLFPLLRRSLNFYLHLLVERDGHLRLPPTYSPESGIFADANFDLALLKWLCQTLLWSCERLQIDDPLIPRWSEVLARTVDFPADAHGFMLGSGHPAPSGHRHGSHLLMVYPLHLVTIDQPERQAVLTASVERFFATRGLPAMVMAHAVPLAASIGRGDLAAEGLRRQAADLFPNGLWNRPPCIEASLSLANGLQTMLLQSWGDTLRVFPAVPAQWADVAFHDLRAEGAFLVSAVRRAGTTRWIRIRSLAGETCRLKTDFPQPVRVAGALAPVERVGRDTFAIRLRAGEEIVLAPAGAPLDQTFDDNLILSRPDIRN